MGWLNKTALTSEQKFVCFYYSFSKITIVNEYFLPAADFAQYQEYLNQQANNETFVRLFEEHVKLFEDTGKVKMLSLPKRIPLFNYIV